MNRADLILAVSAATGVPQATVLKVLQSNTRIIAATLENGQEVHLKGLGRFSIKEYPARKLFNPLKGATMAVPASKKIRFKQSPSLKVK